MRQPGQEPHQAGRAFRAGRLSRWSHDASGSTFDVTDDFSYTSAGLLSRWTRDASGTQEDVTEDFSYDSYGRLTRWTLDRTGQDLESTFTYGACER